MVKKFPLRANAEKKLVKRFADTISNFDEFKLELKGVVWDMDRYDEILSKFPFSNVGHVVQDGIKKAVHVEIHKSIKDVEKSLIKENVFYREVTLRLNRKVEVKGQGFDVYITTSEGN